VVNKIPTYDFDFVDSTWGEQTTGAPLSLKNLLTSSSLSGNRGSIFGYPPFHPLRSEPILCRNVKQRDGVETQTGQVRIDDDVDPNIFRVFLELLYVGYLKSFKGKEELFALADKYQVETLMALCKPTTEQPMNIDDFTKAFLVY